MCVCAARKAPNPNLRVHTHTQVLRLVGPHLDASLAPTLEPLLPALCACVRHGVHHVRAMAAACMAALSNAWLTQLMPPLLRTLVSHRLRMMCVRIHAPLFLHQQSTGSAHYE